MNNETAYLTAPQRLEILPSDMPACGSNDVVIQVSHVGICGSDVDFFRDPYIGGELDTKLPIVLGHECAGKVVETGADVSHLHVGDLVAVEPAVPCGTCVYCRSGHYNLCPDVDMLAAPPFRKGAFSRFISHTADMVYKLPEGVDTLAGAMLEPFSVGSHAVNRAGARVGQSALILGAGCIGMMTLMALRARGVDQVVVADLFDNRLEKAKALGAMHVVNSRMDDPVKQILQMTGGAGADLVFETAGNPVTAQVATRAVGRMGKVILVGNIHQPTPMEFFPMGMKEADVLTVFRYTNTYPTAIRLAAEGKIRPDDVVSHRFPFSRLQEAFETAMNQKQTAIKVAVEL